MMPHLTSAALILLFTGLLAPVITPAAAPNLDDFRLIAQRNIFNQNRSANNDSRASQPRQEPEHRPQLDSFALVGTLLSDQGQVAFFDGSNSDFRKALRPNETIAGHTLAQITQDRVTLQISNLPPIHLPVGMALNRQSEGSWFLAEHTPSSSESGSRSRPDSPDPTPEDEAVLKRLMERREQDGPPNPPPPTNPSPTSPVSTPPPSAEASHETDPVLKRLQEKREQELRK